MKKTLIILISLALLISFIGLVYYGLRHSHGVPVSIEKIERLTIDAPFVDKEIDLEKGISSDIWETLAAQEIKLMYQLMVLPWPKVVVPAVLVKAFHNQKEIYFYIRWKDDTEDNELKLNKFSDACAIMFPLGKEVQPHSIMMGFIGKANIWQWKASQDKEYWLGMHPQVEAYADYHYPFEEQEIFPVSKTIPKSAANDLLAIRVGTVTPKELQNIQARGFYSEGAWQVVFKRQIQTVAPEEDAVFKIGDKQLVAFAAWNGSKGDRGGRKSISDWVELVIR